MDMEEREMNNQNYDAWMRDVNIYIEKCAGCSADDLPDCCYADWHDQGMTVGAAARKAIRSAKDEE